MPSRENPPTDPPPHTGEGGRGERLTKPAVPGGEGSAEQTATLSLKKRRTRLPDGRELIYFEFTRERVSEGPSPSVDSVSTL